MLVGGIGLLEIGVPFDSVQGPPAGLAGSVVVVVCAGLLALRREWPLALIGIPVIWLGYGIALGGDIPVLFFGQLVPFAVTLYSAARHAPLREALAVCGAVVVAVVITDLTVPELGGPSELVFHWAVFALAVAVGWGLRASERRVVDAAVRAQEAEAASRQEALQAVAEERARMARELHDILGHSVSVMVVQAGAAAQVVDDDPAFVRRALEAIRATGTQALDDVRRVVELMRADDGSALAPQPGLSDLVALVEQARADGLQVAFTPVETPSSLGAAQQLALYRVVQEALTNVRRHARADRVTVRVSDSGDATTVSVVDDGRAEPGASSTGHGLIGMQERVAAFGGALEAGPDAGGRGWRVTATLPRSTDRGDRS